MKEKPNWRIDGIDFAANARIIVPTITSISSAAARSRLRKIASPVLPVGERARRKASKVLFKDGRCPPTTSCISMTERGGGWSQLPPLNMSDKNTPILQPAAFRQKGM